MPRYSVDLTATEAEQLKELAAAEDRTIASMLRCLIKRQLHVGLLLENRVNQRQNGVVLLENSVRSASDQQSPDPSPTHRHVPRAREDQEKNSSATEEKKEEKKKRRGAKKDAAVESEIVIAEMNELAGRNWEPEAWKERLAKLLSKGYTVDDMLTVVRWRAREAKRQGDWQWFKPDTLFRVRSFGEKLDNAKAGVELHGFGPTPQSRQQDYTKGVDPVTGRW